MSNGIRTKHIPTNYKNLFQSVNYCIAITERSHNMPREISYSPAEDLAIARAAVTVSESPIVGANMRRETGTSRIHDMFKTLAPDNPEPRR